MYSAKFFGSAHGTAIVIIFELQCVSIIFKKLCKVALFMIVGACELLR